jgi:pyruvate formate lyase activating enzyme
VFEDNRRINRELCQRCGKCAEVCYAEALTVIGKWYDVPSLLEVVERDRPFYEQSGGGVTVSGGEPTLQFDFLLEFLRAAKEAGLNTVIETCGAFAWNSFKKLLPYLDTIYFDLKVIDENDHRRVTGMSNKRIIANAQKLVEDKVDIVFRVPLIPGMTATDDNIAAIVDLLRVFEQRKVHLLPYHKMGESKLARIDSRLEPLGLTAFSDEELAAIKQKFEEAGITVLIGGG